MSQQTPITSSSNFWVSLSGALASAVTTIGGAVVALKFAHGETAQIAAWLSILGGIGGLLANLGSVLGQRNAVATAVALHAENREALRDVAREAGTVVPPPAGDAP